MRRRRDAPGTLEIGQGAGRGEAVLRSQPFAGLVQVGVDSVLGDAQLAGDLLGRQVSVDETQALPLAHSQMTNSFRSVGFIHKMR